MTKDASKRPITVLGIDPGQGWAIFDGERLVECGTATTARARRMVCGMARDARKDAPLVVAMETWNGHAAGGRGSKKGGQRLTPITCFGMGAGRGRWLEALESIGYRADHVVMILATDWQRAYRARGSAYGGGTKTTSVQMAAARFDIAHHAGADLPDHAADAIWVARYAIDIGEAQEMAVKIERARGRRKVIALNVWRPRARKRLPKGADEEGSEEG